MIQHEGELHMRGHRAGVWKFHATQLRAEGLPVTIESIVRRSNTDDFADEAKNKHYDYSGGTVEGRLAYGTNKLDYMTSILTAHPDTTVVVDGEPDSNCDGCQKKILEHNAPNTQPIHCNNVSSVDNIDTQHLADFAASRGYPVEVSLQLHRRDPSRVNKIARIPAGAIQEFVLGE